VTQIKTLRGVGTDRQIKILANPAWLVGGGGDPGNAALFSEKARASAPYSNGPFIELPPTLLARRS
jgi:hypothetical protein